MTLTAAGAAPPAGRSGPSRAWLRGAPVVLPAAVVAYLSFRSGGFFPGEPATVAVVLLLFLVLRLTLSERPLAGVSVGVVILGGALALLAAWSLVSSAWSGAPGRAVLEYDRVLAYLVGAVALGTVARTPARLAWGARLLLVAIVVVCGAGLATRLLPDVWSAPARLAVDRLAYPLTYWNALGLVAAIGTVLAVGLTISAREPRTSRVLAAAATPVLATTLLLTFSRGALAACVVGLLVVLAVGRPEGWPGGIAAAAAGSAIPVLATLHADVLVTSRYTSAVGVHEGHHVALATGLGVAVAVVLRCLALPLDGWVVRRADARVRRPRSRALVATVAAGAVVLVVAVAVAAGAPSFVHRQVDRFANQNSVTESAQRRLLDPSNGGRLDHWRVALDAFRAEPLHGTGAGTFQTRWARYRHSYLVVVDAHSLYLEVLGDLGVVGLLLVLVAVVAPLWGFARLARGPNRAVPAALFAAGVTWALHAGIDWDWEMPATTFWLFGLGGLALAAPAGAPRLRALGRVPRVAAALACLLLAVTPALVTRSQAALKAAGQALDANDCPAAIDHALTSASALASRPEPYEVLGYCDVRLGSGALAVRNLRLAVDRDPNWWQTWYGLALVRGAVGQDPRSAARRALALDPGEALAQRAARAFSHATPRQWRRRALRQKLP